MRCFMRQVSWRSGKGYKQVDIMPIPIEGIHRGARGKRRHASSLVQQRLNGKHGRRYLVQLVNANFGAGDWLLTQTYAPEYLPASFEEACRRMEKFIDRLRAACKRLDLPAPAYIWVTEGGTEEAEAAGEAKRYHHHAFFALRAGRPRHHRAVVYGARQAPPPTGPGASEPCPAGAGQPGSLGRLLHQNQALPPQVAAKHRAEEARCYRERQQIHPPRHRARRAHRRGLPPRLLGEGPPRLAMQIHPRGIQRVPARVLCPAGILEREEQPMTVPCYHCSDRQAGCHAQCAAYRAFRAELDERNAAARRAAAVNDAGAARGDKIRRDVRRHGLSGRKNR